MERAARIKIAKQILGLVKDDAVDYGEESWEADVGRFIDKDRFLLEKQKFFLERPQLIAMSADIPNPGDYYATEIAGRPILLVRGRDGKAKAFLNACRHRGVQLAEGCGHASRFTCPYHGWVFNLEGDLVGVPSKEAFEPEQLKDRGLIELPLEEQIGLILVHPQPDGKLDFDEFLGPMKQVLEGYHMENMHLIQAYRAPARINWKHAVDGGVEGYHVPFLHPETVGPMSLKQFLQLDFGLHQTLVTAQPGIEKFKDLPEDQWPEFCNFSVSNAIFPNTVVGAGEMLGFFQRSEPGDEPGTCMYNFRTYGWGRNPSEEEKARDKQMADFLLKVALDEDMRIQSNSQIMMEAGIVPSVIFSKREANIARMHRNHDRLIGHDVDKALKAGQKQAAE
jgi:phenylpropionate dioxygenase-like ring-hydroxylating dioxygenase large terminal subunit